MKTRNIVTFGIIALAGQLVFADASYQSTTQMTGGALQDQLKSNPFTARLMKDRFAPVSTITMVHGNQKVVVNKDSTEIIDLDRETITRIDTAKKTYTVATFAQMREAMANMSKRMEQAQRPAQQAAPPKTDLQTTFEVSVKNTGATKVVNGLNTAEQVITLQMHVTDPNASASAGGNTATFVVTTDAWIAPERPEVKEVQDFDLRMGQKMMAGADMSAFTARASANSNAGMAALFGSHPGSAEAMAQMAKEMAKLKGTRVMEVTTMGAGAPGSAQGTGGAPTTAGAPLMQMTLQKSNFSREAIPSSVFEVPSGYKKVDSPYERMSR